MPIREKFLIMAQNCSYHFNPGWLRIKQACLYCGVKERTLRSWLREGLPYSKIHGTILINVKNLDDFIQHFEVAENTVDRVVGEVLGDF